MDSLEAELDRARELDVTDLADAIESLGFECTRCGACCTKAAGAADDDAEPHTATVFPDEVRDLQAATGADWRDVARPMPYGLTEGPDGPAGETFEWALQTDACGDCTFYEAGGDQGRCTVHDDRPLICQTYPFSVALGRVPGSRAQRACNPGTHRSDRRSGRLRTGRPCARGSGRPRLRGAENARRPPPLTAVHL